MDYKVINPTPPIVRSSNQSCNKQYNQPHFSILFAKSFHALIWRVQKAYYALSLYHPSFLTLLCVALLFPLFPCLTNIHYGCSPWPMRVDVFSHGSFSVPVRRLNFVHLAAVHVLHFALDCPVGRSVVFEHSLLQHVSVVHIVCSQVGGEIVLTTLRSSVVVSKYRRVHFAHNTHDESQVHEIQYAWFTHWPNYT